MTNQPASSTIIKWVTPNINWDTSASCAYSYDNFNTINTVDCNQHGADILRPMTAGQYTLYLQGIDVNGNETQTAGLYTYDNTQPVWTTCDTDLLDESSRPYYYLQGNVTGDCTATVNTTLYGSSNISAKTGYTVNGNIIATSFGAGLTLNLRSITITGTVTANGVGSIGNTGGAGGTINAKYITSGIIIANGGPSSTVGGLGGVINIASSTTGNLIANGGNGNTRGGNGGIISLIHSKEFASITSVTANGGDATVCGRGGNGGTITATSSTYDIKTANPGSDQTVIGNGFCAAPPGGSSGSSGTTISTGGGFTSDPTDPGYVAPSDNTNTNDQQLTGGASQGSGGIYSVLPPVAIFQPVKLKPIITLGDTNTKTTFSLVPILANYLFSPVNTTPSIAAFLKTKNITTEQDLITLLKKPLKLDTPVKDTYTVSASTLPVKTGNTFTTGTDTATTYLTVTKKGTLGESVTTSRDTTLTISVVGAKKGTITWNGTTIPLTNGTVNLTTPHTPGTYTLTSSASPLTLTITIPRPVETPQRLPVIPTLWSWIKSIF